MKVVGLTGGIGSGKSTVAQMFRDLGVPVYDSDLEAKQLMVSSQRLKSDIIELLGTNAYVEGELNRSYIATKVFTNIDLLQQLNGLVHPAVKSHFKDWTLAQKSPYIIQETALIYENESQDQYDKVIVVTAPKDIRLKRVMDRDGSNEKEVLDRMRNQMDEERKVELADFIILNLDLGSTRKQVAELHELLALQTD
ncbi:dephospho-CoA kinase [Flagellimonas flava]|uniref:Dephospho-CoA kinase n=1 Tax=Flagellimonas flava TaxID=570519 RepID=A0A1M5I9C2_9FLAO|nr:dephospho-CoA kinase [Allomuricauda flava]SHG24998.1 dephospho-CoA kinase [Allomuricauda flava]